jgi:hypothetical protein
MWDSNLGYSASLLHIGVFVEKILTFSIVRRTYLRKNDDYILLCYSAVSSDVFRRHLIPTFDSSASVICIAFHLIIFRPRDLNIESRVYQLSLETTISSNFSSGSRSRLKVFVKISGTAILAGSSHSGTGHRGCQGFLNSMRPLPRCCVRARRLRLWRGPELPRLIHCPYSA